MTTHHIYAYASEGERSGTQGGAGPKIRTRAGTLLNARGYANLRRQMIRSRTVFQVWGKPRKKGRNDDTGLQLTVMLQVYDLKTVIRNERHVLVLDVLETTKAGEMIREEKRVLSPREACRWLKKHHRDEFADLFFSGRTKHLSRKRINFNSFFFNYLVSPSRIFESLLNILVIVLLLLLIPLVFFIVSISMEIDYLGAIDRRAPVRYAGAAEILRVLPPVG